MNYKTTLCLLFAFYGTVSSFAQKYIDAVQPTVKTSYNGLEFTSEKTLFENLEQSEDFSAFSGFLENYGSTVFTDGFMGTVFVMVDASFESDTEEPVNIGTPDLQKNILKFHTVPGRLDAYGIRKAIEKGGGTAYFATLAGKNLGARLENDTVVLFDAENHEARLIATDLYHKHGFFHIIKGLLLPEAL